VPTHGGLLKVATPAGSNVLSTLIRGLAPTAIQGSSLRDIGGSVRMRPPEGMRVLALAAFKTT